MLWYDFPFDDFPIAVLPPPACSDTLTSRPRSAPPPVLPCPALPHRDLAVGAVGDRYSQNPSS